MILSVKRLAFRNFLGFGNSLTIFEFEKGLSLIQGKNGHGKSSLLDALCYNWFGRPYRDIKIDELINNRNRSKLYTETEFVKGQDTYIIKRGLKPGLLEIVKNGVLLDSQSHKNLMQEEINKILGTNYTLFKQIIALHVNHNVPFLSLGKPQQQEILETIFNLKVFGKMVDSAKKDLNIQKHEFDLNEVDKKGLQATINANKESILHIQAIEKTFELDKEKELVKINNELIKEQANLTELINLIISNSDLLKNLMSEEGSKIDLEKEHALCLKLKRDIDDLESKKFTLENGIFNINDLPVLHKTTKQALDSFSKSLIIAENDKSNPFLEEHKNHISDEQKAITKYDNELKEIETFLELWSKIQKDYNRFPYQEYPKLQKDKDAIQSLELEVKSHISKLSTLENQTVGKCASCFQELTEDHLETEKKFEQNNILLKEQKIKEEVSELKSKIKGIVDERINIKTLLRNTYFANLNETKSKLQTLLETCESDNITRNKNRILDLNLLIDFNREQLRTIEHEFVTSEIEKIKSELKLKESIHYELEEKYNELKVLKKNWDGRKTELEQSLMVLQEKKQNIEKFIKTLETKLDFEKAKNFDSSSLEKTIKNNMSLEANLDSKICKNRDLFKSIRILEEIKKVFDKDGIKTYFFNRLIPKLNLLINDFLNAFEIPIVFSFDENFEETITDSIRNKRVYDSFSSGEKFRINFAITLSFIEINKIINNFYIDIFFVDEAIDSSGDEDCINQSLELIKNLTDNNQLKTYLISHRNINDNPLIDSNILIEKVDNFSKIRHL